MRIAFLGWGSLIWNPCGLRTSGYWETDGPYLPIEFARISKKWPLTLVLYSDVSNVQVLWVQARDENLQQAKENLEKREGTSLENIGFLAIQENQYRCEAVPYVLPRIRTWAENKRLDAVVWTDLRSNFSDITRMAFAEDNVIAYLKSLEGEIQEKAKLYIKNAPQQIETEIRHRIVQDLGWK